MIYARLPYHPLLGRHIRLDPASIAYALQPKDVPLRSVRWPSHIGILDQGQIGACTGNAGVASIYREPVEVAPWTPWPHYTADEKGALALYHDVTAADSYPGTYPPDDTGSDGLTVCKVLKKAGVISGYQASLDLASSLASLMSGSGLTGIPFYNSMFDVGSDGLMTVDTKSGLAGGHELCVDEVVLPDAPGNGTGKILVGGPNSWGTSWGAAGRWYLTAADWWSLRQQQGDFYSLVPVTAPAPIPAPPADADAAFWAQIKPWTQEHHVGDNAKAATAAKRWAAGHGWS